MRLEINQRKIVVFLILCLSVACGVFYSYKTIPHRQAKKQIQQMRMLKEFKILQIELTNIDKELAELKAEADKKIPTFNLTPADPNKR